MSVTDAELEDTDAFMNECVVIEHEFVETLALSASEDEGTASFTNEFVVIEFEFTETLTLADKEGGGPESFASNNDRECGGDSN